jgi:hypothetical protein
MSQGLKPRLAEAGKIKIGKKGKKTKSPTTGNWYYPAIKLDHFLVTTTQKGPDENFLLDERMMPALSQLRDKGGFSDRDGKVREIPILVFSNEISDVFEVSYARYVGQSLHCSAPLDLTKDGLVLRDGKATRHELVKNKEGYIENTGTSKQVRCPCEFLLGDKPSCQACGVLRCAINIPGLATMGSVYVWRTKSVISIKEMLGSLLHIRTMTGGVLMYLPLLLKVGPVKTRKGIVHCCHIDMTIDHVLETIKRVLETRDAMKALRGEEGYSLRAIVPAVEDERDYDPADDDDTIDTSARENHPATEDLPEDPSPTDAVFPDDVPEPPPPEQESGVDRAGAPPMPPDEPVLHHDDPLYLKLAEVFVDLCKRRNLGDPDQQYARDELWRVECEKALGQHLSKMPTRTQANTLITELRKVLSMPRSTSSDALGLPGVS